MIEDALSIKDLIKQNEGSAIKNNRHVLYKCPAGKKTCGYGRNAEDNGFSDDEVDLMLENDIESAKAELFKIFRNDEPFSYNQTKALVDMMFNLGATRFRKFKKMIAAIKKGDWSEAANQAKDSKWFKQVGQRAVKDVELLREAPKQALAIMTGND